MHKIVEKFERNFKKKGFTLIEIILVVALLVLMGGISVPIYQSLQVRKNLDVATYAITQNLRQAQALSQSGTGDITWGVRISTGNITLFKGINYSGRDTAFDENTEISSNIVPSGISEIVFSKLFGEPQTTGDIILTNINNDTETITINPKGTIEY